MTAQQAAVRSFYLPEVILYHDENEAQEVPCMRRVMWHFANESRCLECAAWEAQDEKERARVRTLAWAAYHAEHGEPLSLGEAAAMADAMGMTYGQYSLLLSKQKRNAAIK